jgi:hypothetical protein
MLSTVNFIPSLYQLIPTNLKDENGNIIYKKYFPPPPIIENTYEYQNVNKDINLRNQVISFFLNKLLKWVNKDETKCNYLKSIEGKKHINKILRSFVKKYNYNWYDLIDNYKKVKKYIYKKKLI